MRCGRARKKVEEKKRWEKGKKKNADVDAATDGGKTKASRSATCSLSFANSEP